MKNLLIKAIHSFIKVFRVIPKPVLKLAGILLKHPVVLAVTAVVVFAIVIALVGFGLGKGVGNSKTEGQNVVVSQEANATVKESAEKDKEFKGTVVSISVVENDYYYNNSRISLDSFINTVKQIEGKVVVEIKEDNASLKAYINLEKELTENGIKYDKEK